MHFVLTLSLFSLFAFLCGFSESVSAQTKPLPLQHLTFKDRVLEHNLEGYTRMTSAKVIHVAFEHRDSAYLYRLSEIYFFEQVERCFSCTWGHWRNRILVFWNNPGVEDIVTVRDTCAFGNLVQYVRPLLPNLNRASMGCDPRFEWTFKVQDGKDVWFWTTDGFDSREVVELEK